jgi:hypothetical protein
VAEIGVMREAVTTTTMPDAVWRLGQSSTMTVTTQGHGAVCGHEEADLVQGGAHDGLMPRNQAILRGGELAKGTEPPGSVSEGVCTPVFSEAVGMVNSLFFFLFFTDGK